MRINSYVACAPNGVANGGHFKYFFHTKNLRTKEILQYPRVHIYGLEVHPFILDDVAYSICPNLTKNYKTLDHTTWIITYSMQQ